MYDYNVLSEQRATFSNLCKRHHSWQDLALELELLFDFKRLLLILLVFVVSVKKALFKV